MNHHSKSDQAQMKRITCMIMTAIYGPTLYEQQTNLAQNRTPDPTFTWTEVVLYAHEQCFKKALIILPYISIVAEKTANLASLVDTTGCKVKGYSGAGETGNPLAPW